MNVVAALSYLRQKIATEYHHLSLWYFAFFFYGVAITFKLIGYIENNTLSNLALILLAVSIILFPLAILLRHRERLMTMFVLGLIISCCAGGLIAAWRITSIATTPLAQTGIYNIEARVDNIKPTVSGMQVILYPVNSITPPLAQNLDKIRINIRTRWDENNARTPSKNNNLDFRNGDIISLKAKLFPLSTAILPGGYDFGLYLYLKGIGATGYALSKIEIKKSKPDWIENIRLYVYQQLIDVLGVNEGNFAAAILIGETKAINHEMANNLRNSGIAHILSVSGLHLSLVASIFFIASRFLLNCSNYLSYKINIKVVAGLFSIVASFAYLLLTGSNIAATRAFIMTMIVILAIIFERSPYPLRSVMIAGAAILIFSPEYVMHPSFQLSFSAVLCLIAGYEVYMKNQQLLGNKIGVIGSVKFYVFGNIYSSFLASFVTAPFVIYHFYKFATYSIPMNLIAVPIMSFFMMPFGILALLVMPLNLSYYPLKILGFFITIVTDLAAELVSWPHSVINTGYITDFSMFVYTFGFFWLCLWQNTWRYFGLLIIVASAIMMYFSPKPTLVYDQRLKALLINNGKSLSIYSDYVIPEFTKSYWASWFGYEKSEEFILQNALADKLFEINDFSSSIDKQSFQVALNEHSCQNADLQIDLSPTNQCATKQGLQINYSDLQERGIALIYCNHHKNCSIEFGNKPIWTVK